MTSKKKAAMLISALSIMAVVIIGGTLAYFTDTDSKQNVFTLGNVSGTLDETSEDGTETDEGYQYDNVKPGDTLDKQPDVTLSTTSEDAYIRVKIGVKEVVADGATAKLLDENLQEILDGLDITANWVKGTDGYYYYQIKRSKTQTTDKIFTTVTIPSETWGNQQAGATFAIDLTADLIQADNFTPITNEAGQIVSWGNVTIEDAK